MPSNREDLGADASRELVDVVNDGGDVIGQATRAEIRSRNLLHRSVFIAVTTSTNELVVHQRADWKDVWPSRWDICFGGVVDAGESFAEAAVREIWEEAGIVCTIADLADLGEGRYDDGLVHEIGHVYRLVSDQEPCFNDGEVVADDRVALDQIDGWLAGRSVCPDSVNLVLPRVRSAAASEGAQ